LKKYILPLISATIILGGLAIYVKWNIDDYNRGVDEINKIGSEKNMAVNAQKVNLLLDAQLPKDAIDLMLKMVELDQNNLLNRLKLATLYCETCKHDYANCEEALWELNFIIKADSTIAPAKVLLKDLNKFLEIKKPTK
jgi:hypothetical protein